MEEGFDYKKVIAALPENPGVYQYFDKNGLILYIGKAKNLKKRVSSYFVKNHDYGKTAILVRRIASIKTIVVETELDALLLENNLIKKYQPKYNVMLKDDKTYPWICIKNEAFPRVFSTRRIIKDGSEYFGPYSSGKLMHTLLDLITTMFPLRTCHLDLQPQLLKNKQHRPCLDYHIGKCLAPCALLQTYEDYDDNIRQIRHLLKGNLSQLQRELKNNMQAHAEKLEFEKAELLKEKIQVLENYQAKSTVVSPTINDVDVFAFYEEEDQAYISYFKIMSGAIVQGHTIELRKKIEESKDELFLFGIQELRTRFHSTSRDWICSFAPEMDWPGIHITVPKIGEKKQLLELAERNIFFYRKEKEKRMSLTDPERHTKRIMETMRKDLRMDREPRRIEAFDNSNIQGHYAVSAMPVFIDGRPAKKEYRHFNVKTVEGPDDFATMEEIIYRRYHKLVSENAPLPDLIVIDGGKGQLHAAMKSLEKLGIMEKINIIGIAKRLEEIFFPGDPIPLYLDKRSETLRIIQHIRDEAHRFGITHHRNKRSRATFKTELTLIKGISDKSAEKLLLHFKSVEQIKLASLDEITAVLGKSKAQLIRDYFDQGSE